MLFLFNACSTDYTSTDYLNKVLKKLNTIESASYSTIGYTRLKEIGIYEIDHQ